MIEYFNSDGGEGDDGGEEALFWSIVPDHPLCRHQFAYHDFSALRLSDVTDSRQLAGTRVYADWFRPAGVVAELEAGIAPSRVRTRNFVLDRLHGDFSDRDLAVLERVRPHLALIHENARLRQDVAGAEPRRPGGSARARRRCSSSWRRGSPTRRSRSGSGSRPARSRSTSTTSTHDSA
jgi:hypothetical protein